MTVTRDPQTHTGARVTKDGAAVVLAITQPEPEFVSHEQGLAFGVYSTYSLTGGEEAISLKNDDASRDIIIDKVIVSTSASGLVDVFEVTSGTPGGTTIVPKNLNLGSAVPAQATAFGNNSVTGSLSGETIGQHDIGTSAPFSFEFGGSVILPKDKTIAVTFATTGIVHVNILFHFASKLDF